MSRRTELENNWKFKLAESSGSEVIPNDRIQLGEWFKAVVPGTIHTDLLNNNLIDDPFYSDNELKLKWITNCDWIYQTEFDFKGDFQNNIELVFEGLDSICEIYLNDIKLGNTDNMFLTYRFDVKNILKKTGNSLKLIFSSPIKYAHVQEKNFKELPVAFESSRVYIRKAQYSFGWDWGPSFPTSGIWRKVFLEEYKDLRIERIAFHTTKLLDESAEVEIIIGLQGVQSDFSIEVSLTKDKDIFEKKIQIEKEENIKTTFKIENPKLWWPNGEGKQDLYLLNIKILDKYNKVLDEVLKYVGIRKLELLLNEKNESSFKFRINNKDIYCQGVNWIPADSFLPRIKKEKYSKLLLFAREANMNIVRVWGGGIYEDDEFYSLCDQLGLLVWQDFMFACGSYPEHEDFVENVKKEIYQNVFRLQHHPSIAIWCGNNENEWVWYQIQKSSYEKMSGYKIYHSVVPEILKEVDPLRPYWQSSPFSYDEDPNSFNSGNNHQWDIWSRWIDYKNVLMDKSLFVTEFGFQASPSKFTFEKYLPLESRKIQNEVFEFHNKQTEGPERLFRFLAGHLPVNTGWKDFIYLTQLNQALALKTCLEYWKFQSTKTNGSIIWQLNDCWPVTSWSLIDSELRPKMSYYFVRNVFAENAISFENKDGLKIILQKDKARMDSELNVALFDMMSGYQIDREKLNLINENNKNGFYKIPSTLFPNSKNQILIATLFDKKKGVLSRNYFVPGEWKHKSLIPAKIEFQHLKNSSFEYLKLTTDNIAFFVDVQHPDCTFSDRGFILLPGEEKILNISNRTDKKIDSKQIEIYTLNNYLSVE